MESSLKRCSGCIYNNPKPNSIDDISPACWGCSNQSRFSPMNEQTQPKLTPEKYIELIGTDHPKSALDVQVAGDHYKSLVIQPVEYIAKNNIPYLEGNVIKYVTRWRSKGGIKDLEKAKHYIDLLLEFEDNQGNR